MIKLTIVFVPGTEGSKEVKKLSQKLGLPSTKLEGDLQQIATWGNLDLLKVHRVLDQAELCDTYISILVEFKP
jgi:superfamily II DNA/RNA helicase